MDVNINTLDYRPELSILITLIRQIYLCIINKGLNILKSSNK